MIINNNPYNRQIGFKGTGKGAADLLNTATDLVVARNAAARNAAKGVTDPKVLERVKEAEAAVKKAAGDTPEKIKGLFRTQA